MEKVRTRSKTKKHIVVVKEEADGGIEILASKRARTKNKENMAVFIKTLNGETLTLNVHSWTIVGEVKDMIERIEGVPVDQQRLVFSGKQLEDKRSMADYDISKETTLHLVLRLRGGMHHTSTIGRNIFKILKVYQIRGGSRDFLFFAEFEDKDSFETAANFHAAVLRATIMEMASFPQNFNIKYQIQGLDRSIFVDPRGSGPFCADSSKPVDASMIYIVLIEERTSGM